MTNHPGRAPSAWPSPPHTLIRETRDGVLQTQREAAAVVYASLRTWEEWEAGRARMPRLAWEAYILWHCMPGGMLTGDQWSEWLRPEFRRLVNTQAVNG